MASSLNTQLGTALLVVSTQLAAFAASAAELELEPYASLGYE